MFAEGGGMRSRPRNSTHILHKFCNIVEISPDFAGGAML